MSKRISLESKSIIRIESVSGDLRLVGWDNDEILLKPDEDEALTVQQGDDLVSITCRNDLSLNVPRDASFQIQSVDGDMSVRNLTGVLEVDTINGDVAMREVGKVVIAAIESDFSLRGAKGDVFVKSIGGDASLRDVEGSLNLNSVSDDLAVRSVAGNLNVNVDEDVVLHLDPKPGQEYDVLAGEDILVILPEEANATLSLRGDGIRVDWPGIEAEDTTSRTVVLGEGAAQINLNAGGDLMVTSRVDAAESASDYGNFAGMMFDWGDFGRSLGENISRRATEAAERAAHKAEATARRTERQLERQFGRKTGHRGGRFSWSWEPAQRSKADPVTDEERMAILRMLAEKKITSEEAEKLLSALEGGS